MSDEVSAFVADYYFAEGSGYTPTARERALIEDAIHGLISANGGFSGRLREQCILALHTVKHGAELDDELAGMVDAALRQAIASRANDASALAAVGDKAGEPR